MTTRQQIEEVLAEFEGERISDALINDICSAIFRPPFQPKRGQVIAVAGRQECLYRRFSHMEQGLYAVLYANDLYDIARPLNSEELGE